MKGITKSGFAFEIQEESLDNYELLEVMAEVDTNPLLVPKLVTMLLGETQKKKLMEHLRTEHGTVPIKLVTAELTDIFESSNDVKNSESSPA